MNKRFPFYRQYDSVDCGPTCLRMICKYYGSDFSLEELRRRSYISRDGVSLQGISDAAEHLGFNTIAIKVSLTELELDVPFPCVAYINQRHFVVVYRVSRKYIYTADPAIGHVKYSWLEFAQIWANSENNGGQAGILLLLQPTESFYNQNSGNVSERKKGLFYLKGYLLRYKAIIVQLLIGLAVASAIQFIFPFFTQLIADVGIEQRDLSFIYLVLAGQLFLIISRNAIEFVRRWLLLHLSTRVNISILSEFLYKLMRLPLSYYDGKNLGDTLQRIEDHSRVERFISTSTLNILFSIITFFVFSLLLAYYQLTVFLIFIGFSMAYLGYVLFFMNRRKVLDYKRFSVLAENQVSVHQMLSGMQEIKLNNCEKRKRWEWENLQAKLFGLNIESTKLSQYQEAGALCINELKNLIITFLSAKAVIIGDISFGMMLSIQYIIGALNAPLSDFVRFITEYQDAKMSLDRIGEVHGLPEEDGSEILYMEKGHQRNFDISFDNVSFYYEGPNSRKILDGVSFSIPKGKVTAIVGSSGSGKTTLLKLLLKFYQPFDGSITVGSHHLEKLRSEDWRKQCGVVMQDGYLFNDTIVNNITLSDAEVDPARLTKALMLSNANEFINRLPLGLQTRLGNNGAGLSQGQKQRILIARAIYKDPNYIFFDEATSALDATNERIISENLDRFFQGRTAVIIAHRLSTVRHADQILVMDNGKIVEMGSHQQLVKDRGTYFNLIRNQLELGA